MPGKRRNTGGCSLDRTAGSMGSGSLPVLIVQPSEETSGIGGGAEKASFSGDVVGVVRGVGAERGESAVHVVYHQREGTEQENQGGNGERLEPSHSQNIFFVERQTGHENAA